MAMTFTLVSYLRELLLSITKERLLRRQQEEKERERLALEVCIIFHGSKRIIFFILYRRKKNELKEHQLQLTVSKRGGSSSTRK